jgi:septal ring-binding cell division protein DamX
MIRRLAVLPALAVALLAIGCSHHAQNETAEAANAVAADANVTMQGAVNTVDSATDRAFGAAEATMNDVGNAADRAKHKTGDELKDAGNEIEE